MIGLRTFFSSRILLIFFGVSSAFFLASLIIALVNMGDLSYPLILHFNSYEGVDLVGGVEYLWGTLIFSLTILVINFVLALSFFQREMILSYIFLFANMLFSFLLFIAMLRIVSLN